MVKFFFLAKKRAVLFLTMISLGLILSRKVCLASFGGEAPSDVTYCFGLWKDFSKKILEDCCPPQKKSSAQSVMKSLSPLKNLLCLPENETFAHKLVDIQLSKQAIGEYYAKYGAIVLREPKHDQLMIGCGNNILRRVRLKREESTLLEKKNSIILQTSNEFQENGVEVEWCIDGPKHDHSGWDTLDIDILKNPTICIDVADQKQMKVFEEMRIKKKYTTIHFEFPPYMVYTTKLFKSLAKLLAEGGKVTGLSESFVKSAIMVDICDQGSSIIVDSELKRRIDLKYTNTIKPVDNPGRTAFSDTLFTDEHVRQYLHGCGIPSYELRSTSRRSHNQHTQVEDDSQLLGYGQREASYIKDFGPLIIAIFASLLFFYCVCRNKKKLHGRKKTK